MKRNYIAAAACILSLAACSKTELDEGVAAPKGEAVTLTVPQTKVALDGEYLAFEGDETIYAVASNGSTAELTASDNSGKFTGTFSEPVADGSTISLYCHNEEGTTTFEQNGKPWLQSLDNSFTRTENNEISLTATLSAPKGVRAIAVVTDGTGIESLEFHTKNGTKFTSFNGTTFSGEAVATQSVNTHKVGYTNSTIFNVPEGLEGGYWIKAVKGEQAMYKSYSSTAKVDKDTRIVISDFTAASVKLDVQLSGFPTSYSYYVANEEGSGITSKDVAQANATPNDWIGAGKATYTITREGIPSTLLKFESFKLTVDGKELIGTEAEKTITYDANPGHTTWGQKDIVATVTYTNLATGAPETASKTLTRHITGLPYSANPPKDSGDNAWSKNGLACSFNSNNVKFGGGGGAASCSLSYSLPADINIKVSAKIDTDCGMVTTQSYIDISGNRVISCDGSRYKTNTVETTKDAVLAKSSPSVTAGTTYGLGVTQGHLYYINILYR